MRGRAVKGGGGDRAVALAARFGRDRLRVVEREACEAMALWPADEALRRAFELAHAGAGDAVALADLVRAFRDAGHLLIGDYRAAPWIKHHAADVAFRVGARIFATDALDGRTGQPIASLYPASREALSRALALLRARGVKVVALGAPNVVDARRRAEAVVARIPPSPGTLAFVGEHLVTSPAVSARFPAAPTLVFDRLPVRVRSGSNPILAPAPIYRLHTRSGPPRFVWPLHPPALKVHAFADGRDTAFDLDPCDLHTAFRDALRDLARAFGVAIPRAVAQTRVDTPFSVDLWREIQGSSELPAYRTLFLRGESLAEPFETPSGFRARIVLGAPSREHLLEEAVHILRAYVLFRQTATPRGVTWRRFIPPGERFIEAVLQEALGFAASRIANPRRKVPTVSSLLIGARNLARRGLAALRRGETLDISLAEEITPDDWNAALHAVGYFIGRRIESPRGFQRVLHAPTREAPTVLGALL